MNYLFLVIGIAVGAGGYYLYDEYFGKVKALGKQILENAGGDIQKAQQKVKSIL